MLWVGWWATEDMRVVTPVASLDREDKGQILPTCSQSKSLSQITMVADSPTLGFDRPNPKWDGRRGVFIEYELLSRVDGSARFGFGKPLKHPRTSAFSDSL